jgi:hypothetical protein
MKNSIAKFSLPVVAGLLLAGCAPERPVAVAPQVASADNMYVGAPTQPPPKDQKDVTPPPPGMLAQWWFIPGHWEWRGQWVWLAGHWRTRPHSGDVWLVGKWEKQGDVYVWQKGRWRSGAHYGEESNGTD